DGRPQAILYSIQDRNGVEAAIEAGLQAAVDKVNDGGGVEGHSLGLVVCNTENDPNTASKCAQEAADDDSVIATVASNTTFQQQVVPILSRAGVPAVGVLPHGPADFEDPLSYAIGLSVLAPAGGAVAAAKLLDVKKQALIYYGTPAGAQIEGVIDSALEPLGQQLSASVGLPPDASDPSAQVKAAMNGDPELILLALTETQIPVVVKAARQQGYEGLLGVPSGSYDEAKLDDQLGDLGKDIYVSGGQVNHFSDGYTEFREAIDASGSGETISDSSAIGYASVNLVAESAAKAGSVDRAQIVDALNSTSDFETGGLLPPLDFTKPQTLGDGKFPRVFNMNATAMMFEDGKFVEIPSESPFVPIFAK
ncbi:ABC transporter substrate-binding protein, partial [Rhodococcoides fascians]|uniref:ABC transporter substrate-binding protein n=1 Tax=Rhodococcoides fascians TaxID=1828 RepID=UPI0018AFB3A7